MSAFLLLFTATVAVAEAPTQVDTSLITDAEISIPVSVVQELLEIQQRLVTVAEASALVDTSSITDSEKPSPRPVARELLEIQRRLGGSIVTDRQALRDILEFSSVDRAEVTDFPAKLAQFNSDFLPSRATAELANPATETVESLRDAAWQLDQSAENLERSDLYQQADALRKLAQQFRLDARAVRARLGE